MSTSSDRVSPTPCDGGAPENSGPPGCEESFQSIFHLAAVGIAQLDARTGRFLEANERYCELTGYDLSELQALTPGDLTHPDDRAADAELLRKLFAGQIPEYFNEKRYVRKNGDVIWVQINGSLVFNSQGAAVRTVAVVHDITLRKLAQLALRKSEERLQQAVNLADLGIFEHDHVSGELHFSPEMRRIGGWSPGEVVTLQGCIDRIPREDRAQIAQAIETSHDPAGTGLYEVEHRIVHADGATRWMRVKAQTFFSHAGGVRRPLRTIGAAQDVTDEREWRIWMQNVNEELERKVRKRTAELAAQRLAAETLAQSAETARRQAEDAAQALARANSELEQFAYIASHDLQEPLRKIQAFGRLLTASAAGPLDDQSRDYISRMDRAALRMQTLINDLLELSRVHRKGQPFELVDLNQIVRDVLQDLESRISQTQGQVTVGPLPALEADPTQMRQLFQNLIGNALKYRKPDAPPVVRVEAAPAPDSGAWNIEVRDNGIGFEQQYAERIFQPFQRLHGRDEYEGTGMGLAICRRIVERHAGTIDAQGRPGAGTTITVQLPATHPSEDSEPS